MDTNANKTAAELDAQADELLSMMMTGESPETNANDVANSQGQTGQEHAQLSEDSLTTNEIAPAQDEVKNELETLNKRLADSQRKITELGQENATLRNQLADANRQIADYREKEFSAQASERASSIESLANEYEFLKPLMAELNDLRGQVRQQVQQSTQVKQDLEQQTAQQAHMNAILAVHPDAQTVASSEAFNHWIGLQHPRLQQVLQNGTADEVVSLLTQYKREAQQQPSTNKIDQAREMATPNTRSQASPNAKRTYTRAEIQAMPMSEYKRLEADIDAAYVEGRVI